MYTTSQPIYDLDSFVIYLFFSVFLQKETILSILHTGDNMQNPKHLQYALLKTICDVSLFTQVEDLYSSESAKLLFTVCYKSNKTSITRPSSRIHRKYVLHIEIAGF